MWTLVFQLKLYCISLVPFKNYNSSQLYLNWGNDEYHNINIPGPNVPKQENFKYLAFFTELPLCCSSDFQRIRIFPIGIFVLYKFVCVFDARAGDGDVYSSACFVSFEVTDHNALKLTEISVNCESNMEEDLGFLSDV